MDITSQMHFRALSPWDDVGRLLSGLLQEHGGVEPGRPHPQHVPADRLEGVVAEESGRPDARTVEYVVVPGELPQVRHSLLDEPHSPPLEEAVERRHADAGVEREGREGLTNPKAKRVSLLRLNYGCIFGDLLLLD